MIRRFCVCRACAFNLGNIGSRNDGSDETSPHAAKAPDANVPRWCSQNRVSMRRQGRRYDAQTSGLQRWPMVPSDGWCLHRVVIYCVQAFAKEWHHWPLWQSIGWPLGVVPQAHVTVACWPSAHPGIMCLCICLIPIAWANPAVIPIVSSIVVQVFGMVFLPESRHAMKGSYRIA